MAPAALEARGYEGGALALLRRMRAWGYTDVSHSGCTRLLGLCVMSRSGLARNCWKALFT